MGAPLIQTDEKTGKPAVTVQAEGEDIYQVELTAVYEQRTMEFVLTAKAEDDGYGGSVLTVTEMTFTPDYSIGEKLQKAFLNMLMGMGTVFVVLLFISFIISRLKMVNSWGAKKEDKTARERSGPSSGKAGSSSSSTGGTSTSGSSCAGPGTA